MITKNNISTPEEVAQRCYKPLRDIFDTLLLRKEWTQADLSREASIDKSVASRICNGIHIPKLELRLKIARLLGVDSSVIWRYQDMPYIHSQIKKQVKEND